MSEAAVRLAQASALKRFFEQHRTLDKYPTGAYRWYLLIVLLIAQVLLFCDLGFGAILPLWISTLHFTARQFGYFLTCAVVLSGLSGLIGGPLAGKRGFVLVSPSVDGRLLGAMLSYFGLDPLCAVPGNRAVGIPYQDWRITQTRMSYL
jgi:hypothetical protein